MFIKIILLEYLYNLSDVEVANVLKVVIVANNGKPLETEFFAPTLTEFDSGGITTSGISGDTIIITKAVSYTHLTLPTKRIV